MSKLLARSIGAASFIAAIPVLLGAAFPAVAVYSVLWNRAHDSVAPSASGDLMIVLINLAAHIWLTTACVWVSFEMIRRSRVSTALRWVAGLGCISISLLDLQGSFNLPAGTSFHPFILRYVWPALLCIATSAFWSWRTDSIRRE